MFNAWFETGLFEPGVQFKHGPTNSGSGSNLVPILTPTAPTLRLFLHPARSGSGLSPFLAPAPTKEGTIGAEPSNPFTYMYRRTDNAICIGHFALTRDNYQISFCFLAVFHIGHTDGRTK